MASSADDIIMAGSRGGGALVDTGRAGSQAASAGSQATRMAELSARSLGTINPATIRGVGEATTGARGLDNVGDAARGAGRADDAADATRGARRADDAGDAGDAQKSSFLKENAGTLLAGGLAAGGIYYLDQQYKEEKEAVKDCMKVCLPDNWDDHAYGDLEKSELKYKEIADAGEQPLCTAEIEDCGQYCGDKCKEIHDFDAPGSGLAEGLAGDLGEGLGGVFKSIFGGLFEGMGLDTSVVGYASSASSSMICMVLMIMLLK
jgi:hypothetical protein